MAFSWIVSTLIIRSSSEEEAFIKIYLDIQTANTALLLVTIINQ
jgi:hypothetical protein